MTCLSSIIPCLAIFGFGVGVGVVGVLCGHYQVRKQHVSQSLQKWYDYYDGEIVVGHAFRYLNDRNRLDDAVGDIMMRAMQDIRDGMKAIEKDETQVSV